MINQSGDVLGCKILVLPGGQISEKHMKLTKRGELFQMILPPHTQVQIFSKIGQIFLNQAKKIEDKYRETKYIKAKKGVCISTGGFIFNREMVEHYAPKYNKVCH